MAYVEARGTASGAGANRDVWALHDVALAVLTLLVASDALNRFGVSASVWLLVYAMALARIALVWRAFFDLAVREWAYLAFPAVCLLSVLWSQEPGASLPAGIQMMVTILIALFLGRRFGLRDLTLLVFLVLGASVLASFAGLALGSPTYDATGQMRGIYTHKNMLGQRGLFAFVAALALLLMPRRVPGRPVRLAALAMLPVLALATVLSGSVTAILLMPAAAGLLFVFAAPRLPRPLVLGGVLLALFAVAVGPLALVIAGVDPLAALLGAFGRNATLTGRTDLWAMGWRVIGEEGLLGVGYGAFWSAPRFAVLALQAEAIGGDSVEAFHNFLIEVGVGTGLLGVAAMLVLVGTSVRRTASLSARTGAPAAAFALVLVLVSIVLSLLGASLYRQHELMILLVVMLGVAARRPLGA